MALPADTIPFVLGLTSGALLGLLLRAGTAAHLKRAEADRLTLEEKNTDMQTQLQALQQKTTRLEVENEASRKSLESQINFIEETKSQLGDRFKALSLEALNAQKENFLNLTQEKLKVLQATADASLEKRETAIKGLVEPVGKTLEQMQVKIGELEKERHSAYFEMKEYLKTLRVDQDKLRSETSQLVQALRSPSTRGQWGELQLKRTLEMAGLLEGIHYHQQVTVDSADGRQRPDAIVNLPGKKQIVIDSKVPIDAYLDSIKEGISAAERDEALARHARHVRDHIKVLGSKTYWAQFESPEFVVMFLPAESYLAAALERDPTLLEYAFEYKVMPASPLTLVPLLRAVAYGWQQEKLAENAREISELGAELYKRLCGFGGHLEKVGKGLNSALSNYNAAVGSYGARVIPAARKFQERQSLKDDEKLTELTQIEQTPHAVPLFENSDTEGTS